MVDYSIGIQFGMEYMQDLIVTKDTYMAIYKVMERLVDPMKLTSTLGQKWL